MRTAARSSLLVSLALATALGACKSDPKPKADPVVNEPKVVALDAATAPVTKVTIDAGAAVVDPDGPLTKPFFYTATKDGKTIHLLGSIHMGVDPKRLPPAVWDAASAAKAFAMEADISNPFALAKKLVRTDGKTLEDDLGPEYWKKLDAAIGASVPGGLKMLNNMKSLVPMGQLEMLGLPQTQPFELAFLDNAKAKSQQIVYLEEATLQIDILDRWMDTEALKYQLDHLDEMKQSHEELFAGYIAGDETAMDQVTQESKDEWLAMGRKAEDYDKMTAELLHDRNAAWMPKIKELAAKGDALIVVGAAHLVGDGSVIDLLRKDGFTVERVTP